MSQSMVLARVASLLDAGDSDDAQEVCRDAFAGSGPVTTIRFPMRKLKLACFSGPVVPSADVRTRLRIAWRDGFLDRYSPERWQLTNPGALRVINLLLGDAALPTKLSSGAPRSYDGNAAVWWDTWPTIDHRVPRGQGGGSDDCNLVCTSWWRNDTKRDAHADDTGWPLQDPGDIKDWDGLSHWFMRRAGSDDALQSDRLVATYLKATRAALR